LRRKSKK
jgi:hypothetical protein